MDTAKEQKCFKCKCRFNQALWCRVALCPITTLHEPDEELAKHLKWTEEESHRIK